MNLIFSQVNSDDEITELARMATEIWREYYVSIITIEQIEYMIEQFQSVSAMAKQIHEQGFEYYLFSLNDHTVGYMSVKQDEEKLFLSKFYIKKEYRGHGYASQVMTYLEQLCKERSLSHIWLTVNRYNETSIAVYQKKGFQIVQEQVADIGNGFVMDDYIMEKVLENSGH